MKKTKNKGIFKSIKNLFVAGVLTAASLGDLESVLDKSFSNNTPVFTNQAYAQRMIHTATDGEIHIDNLYIKYTPLQGRNRELKLYYGPGDSGITRVRLDEPNVGLGLREDDYIVRAYPGNEGGELYLRFNNITRHGGFNIRNDFENVEITLTRGQLRVAPPGARGNDSHRYPSITFEGDGTVSSGNLFFRVNGRDADIFKRATTQGRRGSAEIVIHPLGITNQYGFSINRYGESDTERRRDFPLAGERPR